MASRTISDEQTAYNLGYDNPSVSSREFTWLHLVVVNAFACGQSDRQNDQPRNLDYSHHQYDPGTFERIPGAVSLYPPRVNQADGMSREP